MSSVSFPQHYLDLTKNVNDFDFTTGLLPSVIFVHGADAFPVCVYKGECVLVAAAVYGKGRVVLLGNDGYLRTSSWMPFISNAISWCTNKSLSKLPVGSDSVTVSNVKSIDCGRKSLVDNEGNLQCSVFLTTTFSGKSSDSIVDFVRNGGGLVCGGYTWAWQKGNPAKEAIADYPGNSFLNKFGFCISKHSFSEEVKISVTPYLSDYQLYQLNITYLLNLIIDQAKSGIIEPSKSDESLHQLLFSPRMNEILTTKSAGLEALAEVWNLLEVAQKAVTGKQNFENINSVLVRFLLNKPSYSKNIKPGEVIAKHSASTKFPGDLLVLDSATTVYSKDVSIDGSYEGYPHQFQSSHPHKAVMRSTGVYAPAGAVISFKFPTAVIGSGIFIRIGCHTDTPPENDTRRYRYITKDFGIPSDYVNAINPFGGLIYICVPPKSNLGLFQVTITGGVMCPYFILDQTSLSDWQNMLKSSVAPWGELEILGLLIFSLPRNDISKTDDPVPVLQLWKSVMLGLNELTGFGKTRPRPERIVFDVAISGGYLHSGYPIMAYIGYTSKSVLSTQQLTKSGDWGVFHELGHNHQWSSTILPGTIETTANVFTLYVCDQVLGLKRHVASENVSKESRIGTMQYYLDSGAKIGNWHGGTALTTYMDLIDVFGWEPFKRLLRGYMFRYSQDVPESRRSDLYIESFSIEVNKNLAPYFKSWGFTVSEKTEKTISFLPVLDRNLLMAIQSLKSRKY